MSNLLTPGAVWIHGPTMEEHEVLTIHDSDEDTSEISVSTIHPPDIYRNEVALEISGVATKSWFGSRTDFLAEFMPPAMA